MKDEEVTREPIDETAELARIADRFQFSTDISAEQKHICELLEHAGASLAKRIVALVPEGAEREIAITSVLSAVLWARQGVTRKTIKLEAVAPESAGT